LKSFVIRAFCPEKRLEFASPVTTPILQQAAATALRIALFRAGPQDLPYTAALTRVTVPLAVLAAFLQYRLTLPAFAALLHGLAWVAALALFTHVLLQSRNMVNRFRQTFDSLLLIDSAMTIVMLPALAVLAPQMARFQENPELTKTESLAPLPALAVLAVSLWNFVVTAHVYRQSLDTTPGVGALVALLGTVVTVSLAGAVGALVG
jgi:hypothetical protein